MKRLGLTLVAALCLAATTFAAGNQPTTAKWEGNINVNKLGKYLQLNSVQSEEVANICDYFSEQMSRATTAKKDKEAKLRNAVYGNLKLMRKTLSAEQYSKRKGGELNRSSSPPFFLSHPTCRTLFRQIHFQHHLQVHRNHLIVTMVAPKPYS